MYIKHLPCGGDFIKRNDRKMRVGSISNVKLVMRKCDTAFLLELAPSLSLKFHYSFSVKLCPLPAILGNAYVRSVNRTNIFPSFLSISLLPPLRNCMLSNTK